MRKHAYLCWVSVNPRNLRNSSFLWNFVPCIFSLHSSLLTDPKSPEKEIVLALGSWEWKAVCLEHFGTVNYYSTKRYLNVRCWRVLTDWQRSNMNDQLPITKEWVKTIFWLTQKGKAGHKLFDNNNTCFPYSSFSCYSLFKNIVRSLFFLQYHSFNKYLLKHFLCSRHSSLLRDETVNKADKNPQPYEGDILVKETVKLIRKFKP